MTKKKATSSVKKEIGVPPHGLSKSAKQKADEELVILRFKRIREMEASQHLYATLLSLKYKMQDYLNQGVYDEAYSFGAFLKEYTRILSLKRKELAKDLKIHETKFSRLINNREEPNKDIFYRIEAHSNNIIPATLLYRLVSIKTLFEMDMDVKAKKRQAKIVTPVLNIIDRNSPHLK